MLFIHYSFSSRAHALALSSKPRIFIVMTSTTADGRPESPKGEPPSKKRRGGRRAANNDISAEERKRNRILKNRESAMRSLAKKAMYSAQLESDEREATENHQKCREKLEKILATAANLKGALDKVPEDVAKLAARVEECITRGNTILAEDEPTALQNTTPTQQTNQDPSDENISGDSSGQK